MAKRDIYQEITNHIIETMEAGVLPWVKPWKNGPVATDMPCNAATGRRYSGVNVLILWDAAMRHGYAESRWMTFRQGKTQGASVRRGEKGTRVTLWKPFEKEDAKTGEVKKLAMLRSFTVFNVAQFDGLPEVLQTEEDTEPVNPSVGYDLAANLVETAKVRLRTEGNRACYYPTADVVSMPAAEQFTTLDSYWATLLHEVTHWTGHTTRMAREMSGRFGTESYAFEELVAEMGSAFLCAQLGVPLEGAQHPAYLKSWIQLFKDDKKALFRAASQARKASEFLLDFLEQEQEVAA